MRSTTSSYSFTSSEIETEKELDFGKITKSGRDGVNQRMTWLIRTHLTGHDTLTLDTSILVIFHYIKCLSLKQREA